MKRFLCVRVLCLLLFFALLLDSASAQSTAGRNAPTGNAPTGNAPTGNAPTAAVATAADTTARKNYADPDGAFAIRIPENWQAQRTRLEDAGWFTQLGSGDDKAGSIAVISIPSPDDLAPELLATVGQVLIDSMLELLKVAGSVTASPVAKAKFRDLDVMRTDVTFSPRDGSAVQKGYIMVMLGRRNTVLVSVSAPQADVAAFDRLGTLLSTFALESRQPADAAPAATGNGENAAESDALLGEMQAMVKEMDELSAIQQDLARRTTAKPLGDAEARAAFARQDAARAAARNGSKERADAAQQSAALAANIAWVAFSAGKYDEAATWFERRAAMRQEGYENLRTYVEAKLPSSQAKIKELRGRMAAETDNGRKSQLRVALDSLAILRNAAVSLLQSLAREHNDTATLARYAEQQLSIRRDELAELTQLQGTPQQINTKKAEVADALSNVAGAQREMALFDAAEKSLDAALAIRRALPADFPARDLHVAYSDLGLLYGKIGELGKARAHHTQALAALEETAPLRRKAHEAEPTPELQAMMIATDIVGQSMILNNLGAVMADSGDYKAALAYYTRALQAIDTMSQDGLIGIFRAQIRATTLNNIAAAHADSGEVDRALKELEEVVQMKRAAGSDESAAISLLNLGGLYEEKGDVEMARRYVTQARQIFVTAQDLRGVVSATKFLATMAHDAGQLPESATYATEALTLARKMGNLGWVSGAARTLAAVHVARNELPAATRLLDEAAVADQRIGSPLGSAQTLSWQARVLEQQNNLEGALAKYQQAITLLEGVRATTASESAFSDMKSNYKVYERIVRLLVKMGRAEEAFDYLSRARSKQLQDSLRLSSVKSGDTALQALFNRAESLRTRLRTVEAQLQSEQSRPATERDSTKIEGLKLVAASTQGEFRRVVEKIRSTSPNYERYFTVSATSLKETQRSVPPGVVFVQYVPLEEQLYIFLVTRDTLKIYTPKGSTAEIWKRIKAVRAQIVSPSNSDRGGSATGVNTALGSAAGAAERGVRSAGGIEPVSQAPLEDNLTALYDMLIAPIEPELADKQTIAFIPNQLLYYLPMQALAKRQNGKLRYLIEDKQIAYLTAADVMKVVQAPDEQKLRSGLIAFGNPTGAGLPYAEQEVRAIAEIFPAARVLSGAEVTKSSVTSPQNLNRRVVHFATHGVLNPKVPDQSYIQLARNADAGVEQLTVGEVWDLPLQNVDLVTLSACETALAGASPSGGEITTLAEAFSTAGATSVIASLWSVADDSTRALMVEFYQQLAGGKSKAAALQAAQIKVMKNPKYSHPFHWAPFILMGDWR